LGKFNLVKMFKSLRKDEEAIFRLKNSLKICGIFTLPFLSLWFLLNTLLELDLLFFESNGYPGIVEFKGAFYDYIFSTLLLDNILYGVLALVILVFMSIYISDMILRPFRMIGAYSAAKSKGEECEYNLEFFTDLKLLNSFSEYFFNIVLDAEKKGCLEPQEIPRKYTKIHKPVFEKSFFLHYFVFILIICIGTSSALHTLGVTIHEQIVNLANVTLHIDEKVNYFLREQGRIWEEVMYGILAVQVVFTLGLAVYFYGLVSAPAFGIFATLRTFLKGDYRARVHLIGYNHVRGHCRKLNKYLDHIEKNLVKNK